MKDRSIGEATIEQTDDSVVRVRIERASDDVDVLYLESGNGFEVVDDGPMSVEVFAVE